MGEIRNILEWSFMSSIVIGIIVLIGICFKKQMRKTWQYSLWGVVLIRLLLPELPESRLSLFNLLPTSVNEVQVEKGARVNIIQEAGELQGEELLTLSDEIQMTLQFPAYFQQTENKSSRGLYKGWQLGVVITLVYFILVNSKLKKRLGHLPEVKETKVQELSCQIQERLSIKGKRIRLVYGETPMIFGIKSPQIILPEGQGLEELEMILTHELVHYKYKDHLVVYVQVLAMALHWFNPLVWWAMGKMKQDMEFACDERVIQTGISKKTYSTALLKLTTASIRGGYLVHSMKESGEEAKKRIIHLANWKKPPKWIGVVMLVLVVSVGGICLTQRNSQVQEKQQVQVLTQEPELEEDSRFEPLPHQSSIALLGVDEDGYRLDTLIVVSIDSQSKGVEALFVPRDTKVVWDETQKEVLKAVGMKEVEKSKISEMTAYGGMQNIMPLTISELEKLTKQSIEDYVVFDLKIMRDVIDAMGGLVVDVPQDMYYIDTAQGLTIDLKAGEQVLNGDQIEQLVRFRRYPEGDIGRIETQQLVIDAFKTKLMSPDNMQVVMKLVDILYEGVQTNLTLKDANKYVKLAKQVIDGNVTLKVLAGEGAYEEGVSYYFPKNEE